MSTLTMSEALALVHGWLGRAPHGAQYATDALAMQVLRKLRHQEKMIIKFYAEECEITSYRYPYWIGSADDPRDAIILAAGQWLKEQKP